VSVPAGPQAVRVDAIVIAVIVLASVLPFAVLGVVPTVRALLARSPALRLTSRATASGRAVAVRRVLVVAQVALAVALLINASLLARSAKGMANAELGFDAANVLKAHLLLPATRYPDADARSRAVDELLARVRALPEVTAAAAVHPHPFRGTVFSEVECEGCAMRGESPLHATPHTVTHTYFADLGIPLLAGRGFELRDDAEAPLVAIVSAALARELGGIEQAVGSRVRVRSPDPEAPWRSVIGVARDVRKTFGDTLYPDLYVPYEQNTRAYIAIIARTTDAPMRSAAAVRRAVAASDPALALSDVEPMEELLRSRRGQQIILASFSGGAAALALALTVSALYAVIAYLTSRRRREFAVRLALGARGRSIVALVVVDGLRLVAVGVTAGVGLAAAGGVLLRSRLFGVAPVDPGSYGSALLVVALVSLAALLAPAVRAGRGSPAAVLREDG
jgi:predicted permease